MNISIETLIILAVRNETNVFQGMWSITLEGADTKQYYFYRCEADEKFSSADELEIIIDWLVG